MRKLLFAAFFLIFATTANATVYNTIAHRIVKRLTVVKGRVISASAASVTLNKGYEDSLYNHSIVYIYRNRGKMKLFGSNRVVELREGVAFACVTKLFAHRAVARLCAGLEKERKYLIGLGIIPWGTKEIIGKPRKSDLFIAGKKEYRIAIITRNPIIFSSLKKSLEKTGRFFVIDPDKLAVAIVENRINYISEAKSIRKLAESVDADLVLLVRPKSDFKDFFVKLYNGYAAKTMLSFRVPVDRDSYLVLENNRNFNIPARNMVASNLRLNPRLTFWQKILGKVGLYNPYSGLKMSSSTFNVAFFKDIGYGTTAFYVGDVNGDGDKEILVAQGSDVKLYRVGGDSFLPLAHFNYGHTIFNIDAARFGSRVLIALSNYNSYGVLDSAIGYFDKKFRFHLIKKGLPYNVRFYDRFDKPQILVQRAAIDKPFYGKIYEYDLEGGQLRSFKLPVKTENLFTFERIGDYIAYLNGASQLCLYSLDKGKVVQRFPYTLGDGTRPIRRYNYMPSARESLEDVWAKNHVLIRKGVVFEKGINNRIYALAYTNHRGRIIKIKGSNYSAYSLWLFSFNADRFKQIYYSGDLKGHLIAAGKAGRYIISVIGLPAGFFDRFIRGILEIDRLTAGQMEH